MTWLRHASNAWGGIADNIAKAVRGPVAPPPRGIRAAAGLVEDPLASQTAANGYKQRPSYLTYELLERLAHRTTIVRVILGTRINQAALFCVPASDEFSVGYRIVPRDRGNGKAVTAGQIKRAGELSDWLRFCGDPKRKDAALIGVNFDQFSRQVVRDSLIYDQMNWQMQFRGNGEPYAMIPMAAKSLRVAIQPEIPLSWTAGETVIPSPSADDEAYVQVYMDQVIAKFSRRELVWGIRNPSTNLDANGYGWSEIEDGIHLCTAWMNAYTYNTRFFGSGAAASGILSFEGPNPMPPDKLEEFKQQWYQLVTGVENAWRTPVLSLANGAKLNWTDLAKSNREMQFKEWMELQVRLFCALFLIDPAEIGFPMGDANGSGAVFQNRAENRIKTGKDKGLRPLLSVYGEKINTHVIYQLDEDFELIWSGLETEDEDTRLDRAAKATSSIMTVDEARAGLGMAPLPDKKGEVVLNQIWLTNSQSQGGDGQGGDQGGYDDDGGDGGQGGGDDGYDDDGGQGGDDGGQGGDDGDGGQGGDDGDGADGADVREAAKSLRARLQQTTRWTSDDDAAYAATVRRAAFVEPTAWDVSIGAAAAGYDARGGVDADEARKFGLQLRKVGDVTLFAKSRTALDSVEQYLAAGGSPTDPGMLTACGAPQENVAALSELRRMERRRFTARIAGNR